jgi:hypothetical protein
MQIYFIIKARTYFGRSNVCRPLVNKGSLKMGISSEAPKNVVNSYYGVASLIANLLGRP